MNNSLFVKMFEVIAPTFKKNQLVSAIQATNDKLVKATIPSYEVGVGIWGGEKFKSTVCKELQEQFNDVVRKHRSENMVVTIRNAMVNASAFCSIFEKHAEHLLSASEPSAMTDLQKITIVKLSNITEFASTYARQLLNWIYINEINTEDAKADYHLSKGNISDLDKQFPSFLVAVNILLNDPATMEKDFILIPKIDIDESSEMTMISSLGAAKIDPFNMFTITEWNPFYIFGMMRAEYQANKYDSAIDEKRMLELKSLRLKNTRAGSNDANLDKEIDYLANRIDKLQRNIREMESDYDL